MRPGSPATGNNNVDAQPKFWFVVVDLKVLVLVDLPQDRLRLATLLVKLHFSLMEIHSLVLLLQVRMTLLFTHTSTDQLEFIGTPQIELKDGFKFDWSIWGLWFDHVRL